MNFDDIDDILTHDDDIVPSPEFLALVMRAVRWETTSLPPLRFPWKRALPGFLATFVAIVKVFWDVIGLLRDPEHITEFKEQLDYIADLAAGIGLQWIVLAVAITILSLTLSLSLARGRYHARNDGKLRKLLRAITHIVRKSA
jgi:hypothetical protein